jgi:hypothetical protein
MSKLSLTLSREELFEITGYKSARKQLEVLQHKGLPAFMRPDHTVSLGRAHYEQWVSSSRNEPARRQPQLEL